MIFSWFSCIRRVVGNLLLEQICILRISDIWTVFVYSGWKLSIVVKKMCQRERGEDDDDVRERGLLIHRWTNISPQISCYSGLSKNSFVNLCNSTEKILFIFNENFLLISNNRATFSHWALLFQLLLSEFSSLDYRPRRFFTKASSCCHSWKFSEEWH